MPIPCTYGHAPMHDLNETPSVTSASTSHHHTYNPSHLLPKYHVRVNMDQCMLRPSHPRRPSTRLYPSPPHTPTLHISLPLSCPYKYMNQCMPPLPITPPPALDINSILHLIFNLTTPHLQPFTLLFTQQVVIERTHPHKEKKKEKRKHTHTLNVRLCGVF